MTAAARKPRPSRRGKPIPGRRIHLKLAPLVPELDTTYVIQHAGKTYRSLVEAEQAALGSFRVITYGPIEGQKDQS